MRVLKITVVVVAIVIVAGFVVLVTELVRRAAGPGDDIAEGPVFVLPDDARVHGLAATDRVVVIHWLDGERRDRLTVLDPVSGRVVRALGREGEGN